VYDFVNFHIQPQVHTNDNRSIMDNLGSHDMLIKSLKKFTSDKPIHVSPVTFNAKDTVDRRLGSAFAAWWTLLALRNLSSAASLSFYELKGARGIINEAGVTKIYEVLQTVKAFSPRYIFQNTGNKVILENQFGERLTFTSRLAAPNSIR
jgi:hypothetical protein